MIVVRITSGMGNQMFQYSFFRLMQKTYPNTEVKVDLTWFNANDDHHGYELARAFGASHQAGKPCLKIDEASDFEILNVTGLIPNICKRAGAAGRRFEKFRRYPNRILREFTQKSREPYKIDQLTGNIPNNEELFEKVMHLDTTKNWYIIGFWIEERYYKPVIDTVRQELRFSDFTDEENISLSEKIINGNSVSLHVRRGDYLTYANMFAALTKDYYSAAVEIIRERIDNPEFYIFSDDAEFVKKEFSWLKNATIVTNNTGDSSYRDMQLMSICKHNIIANSTFSQWGALLNSNEGHLTVYPSAYLVNQDNELKTLPGWIRV